MKTAIFGVWHVHAPDYAKKAIQMGEVIGFYEKDDALAESFSQKFDIPRFACEDDLLKSEAEGIIVCSKTSDHADDIIKIAKAKKHIFTEKVLALTLEDCERIEQAINENGVTFVISMPQKYSGLRRTVKEIAESGELGKINFMRYRNCHQGSIKNWLPKRFYDRKSCGGGAMIDLGAHGMYLTEWLMGMPRAATSTFTVSYKNEKNSDKVEDNAVTVMSFEGGAIAVNETSFVSEYCPVIFEVYGEGGYVRMENHRIVKCTNATGGEVRDVKICESLPSPIEQFLSGNILPGCSIYEAKALTRMMNMAYKD